MKSDANPEIPAQPSVPASAGPINIPVGERLADTPAEFAALFGKSPTWGYRQLYAGRVKALDICGRLLIPRSEAVRLLAQAKVYTGKPSLSPRAKQKLK